MTHILLIKFCFRVVHITNLYEYDIAPSIFKVRNMILAENIDHSILRILDDIDIHCTLKKQ